MNMTGIIIAAAVVGIVGIVIGVLLGIASEKFKVEVDEKEILVRAELPGNKAVTLLQKQLQRARQRLTSVRSAALR